MLRLSQAVDYTPAGLNLLTAGKASPVTGSVWTNNSGAVCNERMPISVQDRKRLWGRAASRCAFRDCRQELIEEMTAGDGSFAVGQEAHIIGRKSDGPRGKSDLTETQRDTYENLILLCARHHIIIDNDVNAYPMERLLSMKSDHELWVARQLDISYEEQAILERYGQIIDEWTDRVQLSEWTHWSRHISNPRSPQLATETLDDLANLGGWMMAIIWPQTLTSLERAFSNFHEVLRDFIEEFNREADYVGNETFYISALTLREAGIYMPSEAKRRELEHAHLIVDLMFELTRAANHVCMEVRRYIDPQFYLREGARLMAVGWTFTGPEGLVRPEYTKGELNDLYPGLDEFRTARESRDLHCPPLNLTE
jgi:hypothetical protein